MARLHLAFCKDDFIPRLLELTDRFVSTHPWRYGDVVAERQFNTWLHGACMVYELGAPPALVMGHVTHLMSAAELPGRYDPPVGETRACITLPRDSLVSLFHQFRHHCQATVVAQQGEPWEHDSAGQDAQEWACSLYYVVRPTLYRKAVRAGRVAGVEPEDLLKRKAAV